MNLAELNFPSNRTLVMGILNVTPDSFADGGRYNSLDLALSRGREMLSEGVDIIDLGGESTRPGSERITLNEELDRVMPVIGELAQSGAVISIDTTRSQVAEAALNAGAKMINDISAGSADDQMAGVAAKHGVAFIAMHSRGNAQTMNSLAKYGDVTTEVISELSQRTLALTQAGVGRSNLILDPGLGFAKEAEHNWSLLKELSRIKELGFPILIGGSRKRFLGTLIGAKQPDAREAATIALTTMLAEQRIWGVRVHDVKAHRDAISVVERMR